MKTHWPLGRGSHTRAWVHFLIAAVIALGGLVLLSAVAIDAIEKTPSVALRLAAAARTWTPVVFAAVILAGSALRLFRPGLLRLMLPAPLESGDIYKVLDPSKDPLVMVTLVAAVAVSLGHYPQSGLLHAAAALVYTFLLLVTLFVALELLAVLLRKFLVPWGHCLLWAVVTLAALGFLAGWQVPGMDFLLLTHVRPSWLLLVAAVVLIPISELVSRFCHRVALRHYRRDELLDYAFPLQGERRAKPRKMIVERLRSGPRARRFVFLLQESTGLYHPADLLKAFLVWLAAFAGGLFAMGGIGGSAAHCVVTGVPLFAVIIWASLRHASLSDNKQAGLRPLAPYALPMGHREVVLAGAVFHSVFYFVTGILAGVGVEFVSALRASESYAALPARKIVLAVTCNLVQVWLILMFCQFGGWGVGRFARKARFSGIVLLLLHLCLCAFLVFSALVGACVPLLLSDETAWLRIVPAGAKLLTALLCSVATGGGGETMVDFLEKLPPLRHFELATWAVPALLLGLGLIGFWRASRGMAYRAGHVRVAGGKPDRSLLGPEFGKAART